MADFPGFRRSNSLATTWINALAAQSNILNKAWDNILQGKYERSDLMRDAAQVFQSQVDIFDSLLPSDQDNSSNVPSWLTLDATKSQTLQALSGNVEIRKPLSGNGNLTTTQLAAFSGPDSRFQMKVTAITSTQLNVEITRFYYKGKDVPLEDDAAVAQAAQQSSGSGPYLGLIYDQRAGTNGPLAVVTLMI